MTARACLGTGKSELEKIFLVIPDPVMAVGVENLAGEFDLCLVCLDNHPVLELLKRQGWDYFCLAREKPGLKIKRTAGQILQQPEVVGYIKSNCGKNKKGKILVFKSSVQVERVCWQSGFELLANSVALNRKFEDKINFYHLASQNKKLRPFLLPAVVALLGELEFADLNQRLGGKMVVQFGRGWAGSSTWMVKRREDFVWLKKTWPSRLVKVTPWTEGVVLINNACVGSGRILVGPPAVQLQGGSFGVTWGRQWPAMVDKEVREKIYQVTVEVGQLMRRFGYRGYFGLDFVLSAKQELFLLENNARLTASFGFFTQLERLAGKKPMWEWHLESFVGKLGKSEVFRQERLGMRKIGGCQVAVRNLSGEPVVASEQLPVGVYTLVQGELKFCQSSLSLRETGKGRWLLLPPAVGRKIAVGKLAYVIESREKLANKKGESAGKTRKMIKAVNRRVGLEIRKL